jgi:hypothetical protein
MYVSLIWRDKQTWFFFHYIDKYFCNMAINTNLELWLSTLKENDKLDSNDITWIEMILIQNPKPLGSKTSMLLIHGICFQLEALGQFTWCLITLKTIGIRNKNPWISTYEISNGNFMWWEEGIEIGRIIFCVKVWLMLC